MAISKHKKNGRLILVGDKVDPVQSLATLEGHLDETKRRAALERLGAREEAAERVLSIVDDAAQADDDEDAPGAAVDAGALGAAAEPVSWKGQREKAQAQSAQLDLAERQGMLVDAAEARKAIEDAVTTFWAEVDRIQLQRADDLVATLSLDADGAREVKTFMALFTRELRQGYAGLMNRAAADIAPDQSNAA